MSSGGKKSLNESDPIVARRHVLAEARGETRLTGAQDDQFRRRA